MPHYDNVYNELLIEHLSNEFGTEVANGIRHESSVSFTPSSKNMLELRATQAIRRRKDFLGTLNDEIQSIEAIQTFFSDIFATLDTIIIPKWYCESFTEQLDSVTNHRQQMIRGRDSIDRYNEHSLCMYLYDNEPWTYPALTAVVRTREAVSLKHSTDYSSANLGRR